MWNEKGYDDNLVKEICYNCGSKKAKQSYSFFRRMHYVTDGKVWSKVWSKDGNPVAFYYATRCRDHIRLIEIAVRSDYQNKGIGSKLLSRLLLQMRESGIDTLTFRTPINEAAQHFWLKMGASIIDVKDDDYEMELKIKLQ